MTLGGRRDLYPNKGEAERHEQAETNKPLRQKHVKSFKKDVLGLTSPALVSDAVTSLRAKRPAS